MSETSEQMNARAEIEAKEFFLWLDGYLEGSDKRGLSELLRIAGKIDFLQMGWKTRA